jgi:hypothetical protein
MLYFPTIGTLERDQTQSLYFLNSDVQHSAVEAERKGETIVLYTQDGTRPYLDNYAVPDQRDKRASVAANRNISTSDAPIALTTLFPARAALYAK